MAEIDNTWGIFGVVLLVIMFTAIIIGSATEISTNSHSKLSNDSKLYVANLTGINYSTYTAPTLNDTESNASTNSAWAFALEFLYAKEKANQLKNTISNVVNFPSFFAFNILQLPRNNWAWLINIFGYLFTVALLLALFWLIMRRK